MGCKESREEGAVIAIENLNECYKMAKLEIPGQYQNCPKGREFSAEFFMIINLARTDPHFFAEKIRLFQSSSYCKNAKLDARVLDDFAEKVRK